MVREINLLNRTTLETGDQSIDLWDEVTQFLAVVLTAISVFAVAYPFIKHLGFPSEKVFQELSVFHQAADSNRANSVFLFVNGCVIMGLTGLIYGFGIFPRVAKERVAVLFEGLMSVIFLIVILFLSPKETKAGALVFRIVLSFIFYRWVKNFRRAGRFHKRLTQAGEAVFYLLSGGLIIWYFTTHVFASFLTRPGFPPAISGVILLGIILWLFQADRTFSRWTCRVIDMSVLMAIGLLTWSNEFTYFDYSNFIGAINDIALGKDILVDTASIYGFLNVYLLALILKAFSPYDFYSGLAVINGFSFFIGYSAIYVFLRVYTRQVMTSVLAIVAIMGFNYFFISEPVNWYPNYSFLRFGMVWPVFFLLCSGRLYLNRWRWITAFVVVLSLFWVIEIGVWIVIAFLVTAAVQFFFNHGSNRRTVMLKIIPALTFLTLLFCTLFSIKIYIALHQWPHWRDLFYFQQFSARGVGVSQVTGFNLWPAIAVIYAVTIYVCLRFAARLRFSEGWMFLGLYGIMSFLYYFSQAIIEKLAIVVLPALVLIFACAGFSLRREKVIILQRYRIEWGHVMTGLIVGICFAAGMLYCQKNSESIFKKMSVSPQRFLKNASSSYVEKILPKREQKKFNYDVLIIRKLTSPREKTVIISKHDTLYYFTAGRASFFKVPFYPNQFFVTKDLYKGMEDIINGKNRFLFIDNSNYQCYNNSVNPHIDVMKKYLIRSFRLQQTLGLLDVYERIPQSESK